MAKARWAAVRGLATAVRLAVRPGGPGLGERLGSLPRLVRATFSGDYTGTSRRRLLLIAGAVLYIVSPVDFVPEALFSVFGLVDDAFVLTWVAAAVVTETESFLAWEHSTTAGHGSTGHGSTGLGRQDPWTEPGNRPGAQDSSFGTRGGRDKGHETVQGHVIR
jgi:uncharacterized membrane protein YkvA (DUF1232 family)